MIEWRQWKKRKKKHLFELTRTNYALYKHLRSRTYHLEMYVK